MAASKNIFLFTGENLLRLRAEKRSWVQEFLKKHGQENCLTLRSDTVTYGSLGDEISAAPFIAQKRLIVVDGIPRGETDDVKRLPDIIHPDCILVFIEPAPDKRLGTSKALLAIATVKEFPHLKGSALFQWIDEYTKSLGKTLNKEAREKLLQIAGEDEDQLATELQKLALGSKSSVISAEDVDVLGVAAGEQEVWILTNALVLGQQKLSLQTVSRLLVRGEDPQSLWNILLWFLRQVSSVKAAAISGERSAQALTQKLGVAFPTARALLPVIDRVPLKDLQDLVSESLQADIALKTGGFKATSDASQEALALLDRLVLKITALFSEHRPQSASKDLRQFVLR